MTNRPPAPDLSFESLRKTFDELKQSIESKPLGKLAGMEVISSPFMPSNVSVMMGYNSMALIYHESGRVILFKRRDQFSPWEYQP